MPVIRILQPCFAPLFLRLLNSTLGKKLIKVYLGREEGSCSQLDDRLPQPTFWHQSSDSLLVYADDIALTTLLT